MARTPYDSFRYQKDCDFLQAIYDSRIPLNVPDEWMNTARDILARRHHVIYGQGGKPLTPHDADVPASQVRAVLQKEYGNAKKRKQRWESLHKPTRLSDHSEKLLEERCTDGNRDELEKARAEGRVETLIGDEAEEHGGCGCIPRYRIIDQPF